MGMCDCLDTKGLPGTLPGFADYGPCRINFRLPFFFPSTLSFSRLLMITLTGDAMTSCHR